MTGASSSVLHWSKLQSNVALSSGEAESNACIKGVSEAIGLRELLQENLGMKVGIRVVVDASACRGMLLRQGSGKVKHLTTKQLWVQEAVQSYAIEVCKIPREKNYANALTHPSTAEDMYRALVSMHFHVQPRRPSGPWG